MNQIKIWEAKLDYLVVRQTHEQKSGDGCREREGSAQIQLCMPTWIRIWDAAAGWAGSEMRDELDYCRALCSTMYFPVVLRALVAHLRVPGVCG
jgi:hypothetical protein